MRGLGAAAQDHAVGGRGEHGGVTRAFDGEARVFQARFGDEAAFEQFLRAREIAFGIGAGERGFIDIGAGAGSAQRREALAAAHHIARVDIDGADDAGGGEGEHRLAAIAHHAARARTCPRRKRGATSTTSTSGPSAGPRSFFRLAARTGAKAMLGQRAQDD